MKTSIRGVFSGIRSMLVLSAMLWGAVAVGQQPVAMPDYVVSRPVINMYATASPDGEVVSQALYGAGVLSLEKKKGWIHIRTGDDYTGWVAAADITPRQGGYAPDGKTVRVVELSA